MSQTQSYQYDESGANPVVTTRNTFYDSSIHYMPTRTETTDSKGNSVTTKIWYPDDIDTNTNNIEGGPFFNISSIDELKSTGIHKRIGQPIQNITINNGKKTIQRTNFFNWGNGIIQPDKLQTLKGKQDVNNALQTRVFVYDYDEFGNPLEFSYDGGPIVSYIWGYNKKYLIAKIENASYQDIATALGTSVPSVKAYKEHDLGTIERLRSSLTTAMVTTYKYDPLVGVTRITDPRGYIMKYGYDNLNRLIEIKDNQDYIISDYKYQYKGQAN